MLPEEAFQITSCQEDGLEIITCAATAVATARVSSTVLASAIGDLRESIEARLKEQIRRRVYGEIEEAVDQLERVVYPYVARDAEDKVVIAEAFNSLYALLQIKPSLEG